MHDCCWTSKENNLELIELCNLRVTNFVRDQECYMETMIKHHGTTALS